MKIIKSTFKNYFIFSFILICINLSGQEKLNIPESFPTEFENSFTFPLGSKIILELKEIKEKNFNIE